MLPLLRGDADLIGKQLAGDLSIDFDDLRLPEDLLDAIITAYTPGMFDATHA